MLCEQVLGKLHDFDTTGKTIEYVDIEWHEAFKKIHKKISGERMIRLSRSITSQCLLCFRKSMEFRRRKKC